MGGIWCTLKATKCVWCPLGISQLLPRPTSCRFRGVPPGEERVRERGSAGWVCVCEGGCVPHFGVRTPQLIHVEIWFAIRLQSAENKTVAAIVVRPPRPELKAKAADASCLFRSPSPRLTSQSATLHPRHTAVAIPGRTILICECGATVPCGRLRPYGRPRRWYVGCFTERSDYFCARIAQYTQEAQLSHSQRDRAMFGVIEYFAKSLRIIQGHWNS